MKTIFKSNYFIIIQLTLIILFFASCKDDEIQSKNLYSISGSVVLEGQKIEEVMISLDDIINYTTTTDQNGNFKIKNVSSGSYDLKIKKTFSSDHGTITSEKTFNVLVDENVDLDDLKLPNPINLNAINQTSSSITLEWDISTHSDFREYKLYRHTSAGLDETTGELIFVSTQNTTNSFTDTNLSSGLDYYYRIYILDDYGKLGGSNLVTQRTEGMEFLTNGSFENIDNIDSTMWGAQSENWLWEGCPDNIVQLNTSLGYNSNSSMEIIRKEIGGKCGMYFSQEDIIPMYSVHPGQKLVLSFYYISNNDPSEFDIYINDNKGSTLVDISGITLPQTQPNTWTLLTQEIIISPDYDQQNNNQKRIQFEFMPPKIIDTKLIIDNISLTNGN